MLSVSGWSVTSTPQSFCVLKGSSVELHSYYTYPCDHAVTKAFWFTTWVDGEENPQDLILDKHYQGRAIYTENNNNSHTLRIGNLTTRDSKSYRFRFITDKVGGRYAGENVELAVTELQVLVNPATVKEGDKVTLTCNTTCSLSNNPTYIWYRNSQSVNDLHTADNRLDIHSARPEDAGNYSCAVKGHEIHSSPEMNLNVIYAPKNTSVSVSPSGDIEEGSSVTLTCSSDANPRVQTYIWYKMLEGCSSQVGLSQNHTFVNISSEQIGLYYCVAENEIGKHNSTAVQIIVTYVPRNTSVSVSPSGDIEEGSSVTLTCSSDANPRVQTYIRYKMLEGRSSQVGWSQNHSFVNISSEQSGLYYCVAENVIGKHNSSALQINVTYAPKNTSVSVSPSGEIEEGSSVALTCSSDANPPVHNYTWYTNKHGSESSQIGQGWSYSITNISSTNHSGLYYCKAENKHGVGDSNTTFLDVHYSPRKTSASLRPSGDLQEDDSVTLTCSSDANPQVYNYTWYRKTGDETFLQGTGRMPNLTLNFVPGVDGLYHCEARNKVGSTNSTRVRVSLPDSGLQRGILFSALGGISAVALLLVVIVCWRRQETQSTKTSRSTHSNTQGHSDRVYDNVSTIPMVSGCGQRVPADHKDDEDDVQYASVQFKPNKQREAPSQEEKVEYASVQFKPKKQQEVPSQDEDIQYASVQFKPNKQQEVPSQDEDVQYASVQFRKSKPEPNVPEPPLSGTSQEETQYASVNLQGLSAATHEIQHCQQEVQTMRDRRPDRNTD
ncbi:B-cell receptor CD22-like [Alosa pseudoharengus]|uniref:B-cell receptor CD22-like n=1 Tax=Alosa pseudoharengus TaxID=34774 RepID=UPI003F8C014B